jgi:hypothetical protein|nr:type II toxin-antitoxin system RelE/ParE family toxin [uncultured Oribacterium sp.]
MKSYAVQITEEALSDMEALYSYIAVRLKAPENAMKQYNRIADAIVSLKQFPDRFAYVELEPEYSMGIHRMLVDHFVVFYVIDNDTVTVTDVLYGASDTHYRWKERHLS